MAIDKITTASITDGTIATADIADGAVTSVKTTGVGGVNTPTFHAVSSSGQSLSSATSTKINFGTETFDVGSNFASSRFTPTTSGKYFCYSTIDSSWTGSVGGRQNTTHFRKNGSSIASTYKASSWTNFYNEGIFDIITSIYVVGVIEFNGSGDYLEVYHYSNASSPQVSGCFGAYKIIE